MPITYFDDPVEDEVEQKPSTITYFDDPEDTKVEKKPFTITYFDDPEDVDPVEVATRQTVGALPSAETINDLMTDNNFAVVGQYMDQRFGMREAQHDRQKIVDSYVNHMRKFNFGQSVTTGTELSYLSASNDTKKIAAGQAYSLFDNMKGAFSEEYTFGQKADAVADYARALIIDPINLVSLGVGKLISGGATKAAAQIAKETVKKLVLESVVKASKKTVTNATIKAAAKKPLTKAMQVEANKIEQRVLGQILRGETVTGLSKGARVKGGRIANDAFAKELKKLARKEIMATAAFDSAAAVSVDAMYQKALRVSESGMAPNDYSILQGTITGLTGVFGGGLAYGLNLLNKAPHSKASLPMFMQAHDNAISEQLAAETLIKSARSKSNKAVLKAMDYKALAKALNISATKSERWAKKVGMGDNLTRMSNEATPDPRRDDLLGAFFHGIDSGKDSFKGLKNIFDDFNIKLSNEDDLFENFTDFITETISALPKSAKSEVSKLYENTMQKLPEFQGKNLDDGMNVLSSLSSNWGRTGNILSKLKKDLKLAKSGPAKDKYNETIEDILDAPDLSTVQSFRKKIGEGSSSLQQNLIRMLITHPGTTALNVVGWTNASGMTTISDMLRGALYGGRALGEMAIGRQTQAIEFANKSRLMYSLQRQKITNLVSPYATKQAAFSFLAANPKSQKELFRYMSGGIELDDVYKSLNIDVGDLNKPGMGERIMDFAQAAYGVKAQDMFTKTQEFMYGIDKQIRIKYGVSYAEFLEKGTTGIDPVNGKPLYQLMKGDEYVTVQALAVDDALRNVYAKSYGGDRTKAAKGLEAIARPIEDLRKTLGIGAMIPFGQFFNNTLAHMFDYSGISYFHRMVAGGTRDPMELLTKSVVGLGFMGVMTAREMDNMEEGLGLFEERTSDGSIKNRAYDFPLSYYKAMGRMGAHLYRDGVVPPDMWREVVTVFGPKNLTRQLNDSAKFSFKFFEDIVTNKDPDIVDGLVKAANDTASMYISGFSRPFDPLNQIIAISRGEDYIPIDRKDGSEFVNKSARYVDQIFTVLTGTELAKEKFDPLTRDRAMAPIGRIFGYREVPGQTSIQRMYNEIGRPKWRTQIKSFIPEVRNDINKYVVSFVEIGAEKAINSESWKSGTIQERTKILDAVMSNAKNNIIKVLEGSLDPKDTRTLKLYNLSKGTAGKTKSTVSAALKELDLDMDVTELNENQLNFLITYLDLKKDDLARAVKASQ